MMKKLLKSLLVLTLVLSLSTACGKKKTTTNNNSQNNPDESKVNINDDVIKDQEVGIFKFEKTSLVYNNGKSVLQTRVTNTSDEVAFISQFKIHVMDGDREIVTLKGYVGSNLQPGQSKTISTTYGSDLTNATSINYEY